MCQVSTLLFFFLLLFDLSLVSPLFTLTVGNRTVSSFFSILATLFVLVRTLSSGCSRTKGSSSSSPTDSQRAGLGILTNPSTGGLSSITTFVCAFCPILPSVPSLYLSHVCLCVYACVCMHVRVCVCVCVYAAKPTIGAVLPEEKDFPNYHYIYVCTKK